MLFIEGVKDYVVIHTGERKIITAMNIKTIHEQLPKTFSTPPRSTTIRSISTKTKYRWATSTAFLL
ncbi:LytTR family transcriptional regulator DNA-binding domain-containing protein [Fulvivirgaceae bacterium QH1ED-6-2]|nr:LytTR family transcriptional regulator DNA-binding domain-containing protein [Parachryseolinea silvisoli]